MSCDRCAVMWQEIRRLKNVHASDLAAQVQHENAAVAEAVKARDAEIAGLTHTLALWEQECGGLGPRAFVAEARREERERCARIAETYPHRDPAEDGNGYWAAEEIAAAIRRVP